MSISQRGSQLRERWTLVINPDFIGPILAADLDSASTGALEANRAAVRASDVQLTV